MSLSSQFIGAMSATHIFCSDLQLTTARTSATFNWQIRKWTWILYRVIRIQTNLFELKTKQFLLKIPNSIKNYIRTIFKLIKFVVPNRTRKRNFYAEKWMCHIFQLLMEINSAFMIICRCKTQTAVRILFDFMICYIAVTPLSLRSMWFVVSHLSNI